MRSGASVLIVLALVLAACGGESAGSDDTVAETDGASAETTVAQSESESEGSSDGAAESGPAGGPGSATLTIGDQVYEFDNYYCAEGTENTRNDSVPFSSGAFGQVEDARVQLDASMYDPDGRDSMEAEGVSFSVTLNDIDDFENPTVAWADSFLAAAPPVFEYDGSTLRIEAEFDDELTDEMEQFPGVLEATCGG